MLKGPRLASAAVQEEEAPVAVLVLASVETLEPVPARAWAMVVQLQPQGPRQAAQQQEEEAPVLVLA